MPELVGSPLSINAVREDLQVSHTTAAAWLQAFERLYAIFRLSPFGAPAIRAVKKEQKYYHLDWSVVPADAPVDRSLRYFKVRFPDCDAWQISAVGTKDYVNADSIRVAPALT